MDEEDCESFLKLLKKSRYAISDRSLRQWQQRYHEGRPAVLEHHVNPRSEENTNCLLGVHLALFGCLSMSRRTTLKFTKAET